MQQIGCGEPKGFRRRIMAPKERAEGQGEAGLPDNGEQRAAVGPERARSRRHVLHSQHDLRRDKHHKNSLFWTWEESPSMASSRQVGSSTSTHELWVYESKTDFYSVNLPEDRS